MNIYDYILIAILLLTVVGAIFYLIKNKNKGCSGCSKSCEVNDNVTKSINNSDYIAGCSDCSSCKTASSCKNIKSSKLE